MLERLQKYISQAGVASRRHAEELILRGLIKVNGEKVTKLGTKIDPDKDRVEVNGKLVKSAKHVYILLNKPKRYMTTRRDPQRRKTIYDLLPADLRGKVWPIGRLDFNTEGLLLLTNDGELTQELTHPSQEHEKEYEVVLDKELSEGKMEKLRHGMFLDGKKTAPALIRANKRIVYLTIHEGWKRQIRRMFAALGYTVRNLKRIRVGKLKLESLETGKYKVINKNDII